MGSLHRISRNHQREYKDMLSKCLTSRINKRVLNIYFVFFIANFTPASTGSILPTTAGSLQGTYLSWAPWNGCSESCGVGVSFSEVHCADGKSICPQNAITQRRRYRVCLEENCGKFEGDLRYSQCSAFNDIPYKGSVHRWEPVPLNQILSSKSLQVCAVNCRRNDSLIVALAPQALDGTSCGDDPDRMCINGTCQNVGCDRMLASGKRDDVCGNCDGNGNECRLYTGLYFPTRNQMLAKPHWFTIPPSSASIEITEKGSGHINLDYSTDSSSEKHLFDWGMTNNQHSGVLVTGGIKIEFASPPSGKAMIRISKKIPFAINVTIIDDDFPLAYIRYEYYRPLKYAWSHDDIFGRCSVKCGKGLLFNEPACFDVQVDKLTNETHCNDEGLTKPSPKVSTCNIINCLPEVDSSAVAKRLNLTFEWMRWYSWKITPWTICTKSCEGGVQSRDVYCGTEEQDGKIRRIDDERRCLRKNDRPIKRRICNNVPCPSWVSSFWHTCSVSCGEGVQHRTVRCEDGLGGPAFNCDQSDKPRVSQTCSNICTNQPSVINPLPITHLNDEGMNPVPLRIEPVRFVDSQQDSYEEPRMQMLAANIPETVLTISTEPSWIPGSWGDCSKTCGLGGVTTRELSCRMLLSFSNRIETIPEEQCNHIPRPIASKPCSMGPCSVEIIPKLNTVDGAKESPTFIKSLSNDDRPVSLEFAAAYRIVPTNIQHATSSPVNGIGEELDAYEDAPMYHEYKWKYTAYGPCSPSCGFGTRRRFQLCIHIASQVRVADDRCDPDTKKVPIVQQCNDGSCFLPVQLHDGKKMRWEISPYGGCTVRCGRGMQRRSVVCRQMPENDEDDYVTSVQSLPDIMCPAPKPSDTRACSLAACPPEWRPGPWSECTRTCGRGVQFRSLACMQRLATGDTEAVPGDYCPRYRPASKRRCGLMNCEPKLVTRRWSQCSQTCGRGFQIRQLTCMQIVAGHHLFQEVTMMKCLHLPRKPAKKLCKLKRCKATNISPAADYEIFAESEMFVQQNKDSKIKITVGGTAYLYSGTTVVVQCPVTKTSDKSSVEWVYEGTAMTIDNDHISMTPFWNLRIRNFQASDEGTYTCMTSDAKEDIIIRLRNDSDSIISTVESPFDTDLDGDEDEDDLNGYDDVYIDEVDRHNTFTLYDGLDVVPDELSNIDQSHQALSPKPILMKQSYNALPFIDSRFKEKLPSDSYSNRDGKEMPSSFINIPSDNMAHETDKANLISGHENFSSEPQYSIVSSRNGIDPLSLMQDPAKELLLFLEMAGIEHPSDEVFQILAKISELEETNQLDDSNRGEALLDMLNELEMNDKISAQPDFESQHEERLMPETMHERDTQIVSRWHDVDDNSNTVLIPNLHNPVIDSAPRIIVQPTLPPIQLDKDVVLSVGGPLIISDSDSVTLICEVESSPQPLIEWLLNEEVIHGSGRLFVLPDHSLRLLKPVQADSGTYTCRATNVIGSDSVSTTLSVSQTPKIISTTTDVVDYQSMQIEAMIGAAIRARLGAAVRIYCETKGHPEPYVQWRKDVSGLGANARVLPDNSLEIRPTTASDQGLYGCEASNPVGSDYQASVLLLVEPPHVSDDLQVLPELEGQGMTGVPELLMTAEENAQYRIKAGTSVIMGCPIKGYPEPEISWTFNGRPLTEVTHVLDYQTMLQQRVLQIPEVDEDTVGSYACNASNDGGQLLTSLQLELIAYSWSLGEMSDCSATCGGSGVQHKKLLCMEDENTTVDQWYCTGMNKPDVETIPCNRLDCPARYHSGEWSTCSQTCGDGERTRSVTCRVFLGNGFSKQVDENVCSVVGNFSIPVTGEKCSVGKCPYWRPGPWSKCSRKCAGRYLSWKTRRLYCVSNTGENLDRSECKKSERPLRRDTCENKRCAPVWVASRWSSCSKSCGIDGIQTRILNCVYRGNKRQHAGTRCPKSRRPLVTSPCNRIACNEGPRVHSVKPPAVCKDKSLYCRKAKMARLCSFYQHLCCESCNIR